MLVGRPAKALDDNAAWKEIGADDGAFKIRAQGAFKVVVDGAVKVMADGAFKVAADGASKVVVA